MVNAKTISPKKRKSIAGNADTPIQAKKAKPDPSVSVNQTPGKKASVNQTPGKKGNQTPAKTPQQKTEKQTPKPATPANKVQMNSAKKQNGKPQQSPSSPKKMKKFGGTAELVQSTGEKNVKSPQKKNKSEKKAPGSPKRKNKGTFFHLQCTISEKGDKAIGEIDAKIKAFESRTDLTKTARRKLKMLKKLRHVALTGEKPKPVQSEKKGGSNQNLTKSQRKKLNKKEAKNRKKTGADNVEQQEQPKQKLAEAGKKQPKQQQQKQKPAEVKKISTEIEYSEEDSSNESEIEEVILGKRPKLIKKQAGADSDEDSDEDEAVDEEEEDDDDSEFGEEVVEEEVEESDDGEEDEEEDDDEEESESELNATGNTLEAEDSDDESDSEESEELPSKPAQKPVKNNQQKPAQQKLPAAENKNAKGSSRYVLFIGNLPYDATREDILNHFKKAGPVKDVRIPLDQKTNKPRGFAYLEVENAQTYEKGLSMNHTMVKGRRINVQYSEGGKKKNDDSKNRIKQKNAKFNDMRKKGQLAGSVKEDQKRGARRNKGKKVNGDS